MSTATLPRTRSASDGDLDAVTVAARIVADLIDREQDDLDHAAFVGEITGHIRETGIELKHVHDELDRLDEAIDNVPDGDPVTRGDLIRDRDAVRTLWHQLSVRIADLAAVLPTDQPHLLRWWADRHQQKGQDRP